MSLTHKCLLVDIFLTRSLSKSLAFYEFASINFKPWLFLSICLGGQWNSTLSLLDFFPYIKLYSLVKFVNVRNLSVVPVNNL